MSATNGSNGATANGATQPRTSPFPPGWNDAARPLVSDRVAEAVLNATLARQAWFQNFLDPRRNLEDECGYPPIDSTPSVDLYRQLYDREPIANRVVQCMPKESWQLSPLVYEDDSTKTSTPFEEHWDDLGQQLTPGGGVSWHQDEEGSPVWADLLKADTLSRVGRFGLLLLGVDDGKGLETPLEGVVAAPLMNRKTIPILAPDPRNPGKRRRVGVRLGKLVRNERAAIPDAFLRQGDEDWLLDDRSRERQTWNVREKRYDAVQLPPLTDEERAVIGGWIHERQLALNAAQGLGNSQAIPVVPRRPLTNAPNQYAGERGEYWGDRQPGDPSPQAGAMPDAPQRPADGTSSQDPARRFASQPDAPDASHAADRLMAERTFDQAKDSDGKSPFTDWSRPEDGSSYLAGTDSQYYGVHFGPSQFPAGREPGNKQSQTGSWGTGSPDKQQQGSEQGGDVGDQGPPQTAPKQGQWQGGGVTGGLDAAPTTPAEPGQRASPNIGGGDGNPPSSPTDGVPDAGGASPSNPSSGTVSDAGDTAAGGDEGQAWGAQEGTGPAKQPFQPRQRLLFLASYDESLVQIVRWEWNIRNPRFRMPVMYRVTLTDPRDGATGVGLPYATVFVHWSRVIHVADGHANATSSETLAQPVLKPVLNRVLDVRKVSGSSAEGYWKSCFNGLSFETHPQLGGEVLIDKRALKDEAEMFQNSLDRTLVTSGMAVNTIAPQVIDPTPHLAAMVEHICIQIGVPKRVFMGSERGELASSQDDASWNDRVNQRRHGYITPRIIVPFIDRLIQAGILPEPEGYSVEWPDLDSTSDMDKATIGGTRTTALAAYIAGGCDAMVPPLDFLVEWQGLTEERAAAILRNAAKVNELKEQAAQTEQAAAGGPIGPDGLPMPAFGIPGDATAMTGPDGQPIDPNALPQPGQPGAEGEQPEQPAEPPPAPVKMREGETLVDPATGKPVGEARPEEGPFGMAANAAADAAALRQWSLWFDAVGEPERATWNMVRDDGMPAYAKVGFAQRLELARLDRLAANAKDAKGHGSEKRQVGFDLVPGVKSVKKHEEHEFNGTKVVTLDNGDQHHIYFDRQSSMWHHESPGEDRQKQLGHAASYLSTERAEVLPYLVEHQAEFKPQKRVENATNFNERVWAAAQELNKHPGRMPGYGRVFTRSGPEVWYVGGDGDEPAFSELVDPAFKACGAKRVFYYAEKYPKEDSGFKEVIGPKDVQNAAQLAAHAAQHGLPAGSPLTPDLREAEEWAANQGQGWAIAELLLPKEMLEDRMFTLNQAVDPRFVSQLLVNEEGRVRVYAPLGNSNPEGHNQYTLANSEKKEDGTQSHDVLYAGEKIGKIHSRMEQPGRSVVYGGKNIGRGKPVKRWVATVDVGHHQAKEVVQHPDEQGNWINTLVDKKGQHSVSGLKSKDAALAAVIEHHVPQKPTANESPAQWEEAKHPRGGPKNKGQFGAGGGGGGAVAPAAAKPAAPTLPDPAAGAKAAAAATHAPSPGLGVDAHLTSGDKHEGLGGDEHAHGQHAHGPEGEVEHAAHQAHLLHEGHEVAEVLGGGHEHAAEALHGHFEEAAHGHAPDAHVHGPEDVAAIVASHLYGPALKAVSAVLAKVPGAGRVAAAISNLHAGASKLADKAVAGMQARYGKATAGAILGAGSLSIGSVHALAGIPGTVTKSLPAKNLIGAIPLLAVAEAGKRLGLLGPNSRLESGLVRAGSWIHAIKSAVKGGASAVASTAGAAGLKGARLAGRGVGKLIGNERDGYIVVNSLGEHMAEPGWVLVGPDAFVLVGQDGRVVTR